MPRARVASPINPLANLACARRSTAAPACTTMTILHVTDFHFNKRWFDWLLHRAADWLRTLFLNPGRNPDAPFPNHLLVRTEQISSQLFSACPGNSHDAGFFAHEIINAESITAMTAVA